MCMQFSFVLLNRSHFDMLLFFFVPFYMCFFQMMYAVMLCVKQIRPRETSTTHTRVHSIWCWILVPNASESSIFVSHVCALFVVCFSHHFEVLLYFSIVSSHSSICIIALHFRNCNRFSFDDIQCVIYTSTYHWMAEWTYILASCSVLEAIPFFIGTRRIICLMLTEFLILTNAKLIYSEDVFPQSVQSLNFRPHSNSKMSIEIFNFL